MEIETPFWSTWLDNSKAKFLLGLAASLRPEAPDRGSLDLSAKRIRPAPGLVSGLVFEIF